MVLFNNKEPLWNDYYRPVHTSIAPVNAKAWNNQPANGLLRRNDPCITL